MSLREQMLQKVAFAPEKFSLEQLKRGVQDGTIPAYIGVPAIQERMKLAQQAQAAMSGQAPQQVPIAQQIMQQAQQAGVEQLPSNLPAEGMAGGGIVAFAGPDGSLVSDDEVTFDEYGVPRPSKRFLEQAKAPTKKAAPYQPPSDLRSMWDRITNYYQSPSSLEGVQRNVEGTLQAVSPVLPGIKGVSAMAPSTGLGLRRVLEVPAYAGAAAEAGKVAARGKAPSTAAPVEQPPRAPEAPAPAAEQPAPSPEPAPAPAGIDKLVTSGEAPFAPDEVFRRLTIGRGELPTMNYSKTEANIAERRKGLEQDKRDATGEALMAAGFAMMAGTSPYALTNVGAGGIAGLKQYMTGKKDISDLEKDIMSAEAKMEDAKNNQEWKKYEAAQNDLALKTGIWKTMATITGENERARMYSAAQSTAMERALMSERGKTLRAEMDEVAKELKALTIAGTPMNKPEAERLRARYASLEQQLYRELGMSGVTPASAGAPSNIPPYNRSKVTPQ